MTTSLMDFSCDSKIPLFYLNVPKWSQIVYDFADDHSLRYLKCVI